MSDFLGREPEYFAVIGEGNKDRKAADDAMDKWHEFASEAMSKLKTWDISPHEWMGWTREEFAEWVMRGYAAPIKRGAPCYDYIHKSAGDR